MRPEISLSRLRSFPDRRRADVIFPTRFALNQDRIPRHPAHESELLGSDFLQRSHRNAHDEREHVVERDEERPGRWAYNLAQILATVLAKA